MTEPANVTNPGTKAITAHEIKVHLDTKVVGQEIAKIQISVLLSMHMNWFKHEERMDRSPNAVLIGPTGVGKTHTIRVASEYLKIPFITVDTTTLVPSGIAGLQVEDILGDLVREANEIIKQEGRARYKDDDIELARRGIMFFDEFDKINAGGASRSYDQSNNLSVQRSLLKLTDGSKKRELACGATLLQSNLEVLIHQVFLFLLAEHLVALTRMTLERYLQLNYKENWLDRTL